MRGKTRSFARGEVTVSAPKPVLGQREEGKGTKPEMTRRTDKVLLCYIYTGCSPRHSESVGREKVTRPEQVKRYLALEMWVHIHGVCPWNSALHLTVWHYSYLTLRFRYLTKLIYLKAQNAPAPPQSRTQYCCFPLFSSNDGFLPNATSIPQRQLSQTTVWQNIWLGCFLKMFSAEKWASRNGRSSLAEPPVI